MVEAVNDDAGALPKKIVPARSARSLPARRSWWPR
jgi:hypothetical protein